MVEPPSILVDRSLGTNAVPAVFRNAGFHTLTIDDVFGPRPVPDTEWIELADDNGMVVVCKDNKIRTNPLERQALFNSSIRVFCLTNGHLGVAEQAERFEQNMTRIRRRLRTQGGRPWVYAVHATELRRLHLYQP
ncbi:hypothetical protein [Oerskovia flava]|uniref:PIN-like domain-containing protein n=1 Tax=Oerskovia flava TaxID=2986422 RepID=UPI002240A2AD|nr:hypothetical protein [Oerskovia sp. JB1-3-2]